MSADAGDPASPGGTVFPTDEITRHLTPRENQVLVLLYEGYRYREIAQMLFVSLTTVRTHIHHIYEKLGISRKEELFVRVRNTRNAAATVDTPASPSVLIRRSSSE
jgi:ATP/maltotriose-dependent transcriptional regulator MalT